jgi:hypothetical protein
MAMFVHGDDRVEMACRKFTDKGSEEDKKRL